jgi:hypothetical protein
MIEAAFNKAVVSKINVSTSINVPKACSVSPCEVSVCAVVAGAEALLNRDAISPVKRLTYSVENSSAIVALRSGRHYECSVRSTSPVECVGTPEVSAK